MDLYQPSELPWRLTVADGAEWDICDTFMNSAKEVSFDSGGDSGERGELIDRGVRG